MPFGTLIQIPLRIFFFSFPYIEPSSRHNFNGSVLWCCDPIQTGDDIVFPLLSCYCLLFLSPETPSRFLLFFSHNVRVRRFVIVQQSY